MAEDSWEELIGQQIQQLRATTGIYRRRRVQDANQERTEWPTKFGVDFGGWIPKSDPEVFFEVISAIAGKEITLEMVSQAMPPDRQVVLISKDEWDRVRPDFLQNRLDDVAAEVAELLED